MSIGSVTHSQNNVINAIASASQRTGADFDYLVRTATRESGLRTHVSSSTSTAAGPFQFIEQTWLSTLKEHGGTHGFGAYADAIQRDANGRYQIADDAQRQEILALRHDARASSLMAGEMTNDASRGLERALGRPLRENEPYVAHFMGQGGATRLIREVDTNPETIAADMFPRAANANQRIFYNQDGSARTVSEVYQNLTGLPEAPASAAAAASQVAAVEQVAAEQRPAGRRATPLGSVQSFTPTRGHASAPGSMTMMLTPQVIELLQTLNPTAAFGQRDEDDRSSIFNGV